MKSLIFSQLKWKTQQKCKKKMHVAEGGVYWETKMETNVIERFELNISVTVLAFKAHFEATLSYILCPQGGMICPNNIFRRKIEGFLSVWNCICSAPVHFPHFN